MSGSSAFAPPVELGRNLDRLGEIESRLGYRMHRTDLLHMQLLREHLSDIGLTPARATALAFVRSNPGAGQSDLARALDINRASAMEMVNQLVRIGAIERREGRNHRTNALHLTPEGNDLYARFIAITSEIDQQTCADLNAEELAQFERLLSRINATLLARLEPDTNNQ
jgi:DNA-binding MarR family transcriptional regulator